MRKFWLTSKNDSRLKIDLMDKDSFGSSPQGLGVSTSGDVFNLGTNTVLRNQEVEFEEITFQMIFGAQSGDFYEKFLDFINKCNKLDLILNYDFNGTIYNRDVQVTKITKGEVNSNINALVSEVTLQPLTPWYEWVTVPKNFTNGLIEIPVSGCIHLIPDQTIPIEINWTKTSGASEQSIIQISVYNRTSSGGQGSLISKVIFDPNSVLGFKLKATGDFYFKSDYTDIQAYMHSSSGLAKVDLLPTIDTSSNGIGRIPANTNCLLNITGLTASDTITVKYKREKVIV